MKIKHLILAFLTICSCGETIEETLDLWEDALEGTVVIEVKSQLSGEYIEGAIVKLDYLYGGKEDYDFAVTNEVGRVVFFVNMDFIRVSCNKGGYMPYYSDNWDDFTGTILLAQLSAHNDGDGDGITNNLDLCPDTPNDQSVDSNGCSHSQKTYVPDENFEQRLINDGYDDVLDNYLSTSVAHLIKFLVLRRYNISDLTGIEDFVALRHLYCEENQLTTLYLSNNTDLTILVCRDNLLTSLDVSNILELERFDCTNNLLSCIKVNQTQLSNITTHWHKDNSASYSLTCN